MCKRGSRVKYLAAMLPQTEAPSGERQMRENRGAEGAEWDRVWGGMSHPQPTRGSGEAS